jgi:hypothetical protein
VPSGSPQLPKRRYAGAPSIGLPPDTLARANQGRADVGLKSIKLDPLALLPVVSVALARL